LVLENAYAVKGEVRMIKKSYERELEKLGAF